MWPEYVTDAFNKIDPKTAHPDEFNGAWNVLLFHLFDPSEGYNILPQPLIGLVQFTRNKLYLELEFKISKHQVPFIFVKVGSQWSLNHHSSRADEDESMRNRFRYHFSETGNLCYGISALGRRFAVYSVDKETLALRPSPAARRDYDCPGLDIAPEEWWKLDVLSEEGERRLREGVVAAAKAMVET